jgi:hypothetical protein
MATARARLEWSQVSHLMWASVVPHVDPKKSRQLTPAEFNPMATKDERRRAKGGTPITKKNLSILKRAVLSAQKARQR